MQSDHLESWLVKAADASNWHNLRTRKGGPCPAMVTDKMRQALLCYTQLPITNTEQLSAVHANWERCLKKDIAKPPHLRSAERRHSLMPVIDADLRAFSRLYREYADVVGDHIDPREDWPLFQDAKGKIFGTIITYHSLRNMEEQEN